MGLDLFDILAVIFGVLFTIRKLDAQRRLPKEFPQVPQDEFLDWRARETAAYSLGMIACFSKVIAKLLVVYVFHDKVTYQMLRLLGMSIDLSWVALTGYTLYRAHLLTKERNRLGIVLGGFIVSSDGSEMGAELKVALGRLRDGEVEAAAQELHRISLCADETQKALALYWLGECFVKMGREVEAKDAFLEALEVDPKLLAARQALERLEPSEHKSSP